MNAKATAERWVQLVEEGMTNEAALKQLSIPKSFEKRVIAAVGRLPTSIHVRRLLFWYEEYSGIRPSKDGVYYRDTDKLWAKIENGRVSFFGVIGNFPLTQIRKGPWKKVTP